MPLIYLGDCQPVNATTGKAVAAQHWALLANASLVNGEMGCVGVSRDSGPPSTLWAKPLAGGRTAVLAINGADMPQEVDLDLAALLGSGEEAAAAEEWAVRNVWTAHDMGRRGTVTATLAAHDCLMLVVRPAGEELLAPQAP